MTDRWEYYCKYRVPDRYPITSILTCDINIQTEKDIETAIETIEDCYDFRQTYLKALVASVSKDLIKEVW